MKQVSIINETDLGQVDQVESYNTIEELASIARSASWAPATFRGRRTLATLESIDLLVLDVDDGCSLEEAKEHFKVFKHIIGTSRSHQKEKKGKVSDRFRVILFLSEAIANDDDYKETWENAKKRWNFIDTACKDSSRFFYPCTKIVSMSKEGKTFDVVKYQGKVIERRNGELTRMEKGDLWKSTLDFLVRGAPAGQRHYRLIQAVGNMREQGYSQEETVELLEKMTETGEWTQLGLSRIDLATIERMYSREMKYEYKEKDDSGDGCTFVRAGELTTETFEYLADKDKVKGESTGIVGLDSLLGGGFRQGELTVLMAQAKTGKNTFYHYLIYRYLQKGIPFGYASRELSPATEVIPNLISISTGMNAWKAEIDDKFKSSATQIVNEWPLYFAPGYGFYDPVEMEKWFIELKNLGINHFLFDHFHYALQGEDYEATAKLIKHMKSLTKKLDIHLSLIVQPRSLREGERLSLATLRGGAAIGQALDNLMILERVRGEQNISKLTLEVARHKLAKLGSVYLQYDPVTTAFVEVDRVTVADEEAPQPTAYSQQLPRRFNARHEFNEQ